MVFPDSVSIKPQPTEAIPTSRPRENFFIRLDITRLKKSDFQHFHGIIRGKILQESGFRGAEGFRIPHIYGIVYVHNYVINYVIIIVARSWDKKPAGRFLAGGLVYRENDTARESTWPGINLYPGTGPGNRVWLATSLASDVAGVVGTLTTLRLWRMRPIGLPRLASTRVEAGALWRFAVTPYGKLPFLALLVYLAKQPSPFEFSLPKRQKTPRKRCFLSLCWGGRIRTYA